MNTQQKSPPQLPDFMENVCRRLADRTFGYAICSVTVTWVLVLLPQFYAVYAERARYNPDIGMIEVLNLMWTGGIVIFALLLGFMIGGLALYHSISWAKALLTYLFTLWGLIILWEIRYNIQVGGPILPDARGIVNLSIILVAIIFLLLIYLAYKKKNLLTIRVMALMNIVFTIWNLYLTIAIFITGHVHYLQDRHIEYLALVFLAIVILQAVTCFREFVPAYSRAASTPSS